MVLMLEYGLVIREETGYSSGVISDGAIKGQAGEDGVELNKLINVWEIC